MRETNEQYYARVEARERAEAEAYRSLVNEVDSEFPFAGVHEFIRAVQAVIRHYEASPEVPR